MSGASLQVLELQHESPLKMTRFNTVDSANIASGNLHRARDRSGTVSSTMTNRQLRNGTASAEKLAAKQATVSVIATNKPKAAAMLDQTA